MKTPETTDERLKKKRAIVQAYKNIFLSKDGEIVMEDMRKRFFADAPTSIPGMPDWMRDQHEGMRRAFLHVQNRRKTDLNTLTLTIEDE